MRRVVLIVISSLFLSTCGEPDVALWGSIDETFSLEFDRHEIKKQGTSLLIEYIKEDDHGGVEKPCKLVVETANLLIEPNSQLDTAAFEDGIVQIERIALGGAEYPSITGGTIHFKDYQFVDGAIISGKFTLLFENGRNLFGNFYAEVEEIEEDPVP